MIIIVTYGRKAIIKVYINTRMPIQSHFLLNYWFLSYVRLDQARFNHLQTGSSWSWNSLYLQRCTKITLITKILFNNQIQKKTLTMGLKKCFLVSFCLYLHRVWVQSAIQVYWEWLGGSSSYLLLFWTWCCNCTRQLLSTQGRIGDIIIGVDCLYLSTYKAKSQLDVWAKIRKEVLYVFICIS